MARDHARIHLDIWGDDEFLDLPVDAQMLYFTLYTSDGRTLCGAHDWNPKRLTQRAADWTVERIDAAAQILSERLFLIIDTDTDECLMRSWIKHDGLWRTPNMAVSVANARAKLASRTLRGVIVFEVLKLRAAEPDSTSWAKPAVQSMLTQKAFDAADLPPFNRASNPGGNTGSKGASNPYELVKPGVGVNGGSNPGPTNAIPIANATPANAGEPRARNRTFSEIARGAPDPPPAPLPPDTTAPGAASATKASRLVAEHVTAGRYADTTVAEIRTRTQQLLAEGVPDELMAATLRYWDEHDGGPGLLRSYLAEAAKTLRPFTGTITRQGTSSAKAAGWLGLADELDPRHRDTDQPEIEG